MHEALVFRRVRAIDPSRDLDAQVDVVVEGKTITRVGPGAGDSVTGERVRTVEVPGAYLLPGLIDLHAHLREPGQEGKEDLRSGLAARGCRASQGRRHAGPRGARQRRGHRPRDT